MRLSIRAKQILALLLTGTLVTAMLPLNVIGAPANEEPSQGNTQKRGETLNVQGDSSHLTIKTDRKIVQSVNSKNGRMILLSSSGDEELYNNSIRNDEYTWTPDTQSGAVYLAVKDSHPAVENMYINLDNDDSFILYLFAVADGVKYYVSKYNSVDITGLNGSFESSTAASITYPVDSGITDTYLLEPGQLNSDSYISAEDGENAKIEEYLRIPIAFDSTANTGHGIKLTTDNDRRYFFDTDTDTANGSFSLSASSNNDKAYTGDTISLEMTVPSEVSGTRYQTEYYVKDGDQYKKLDSANYTIPQDYSGSSVTFMAKAILRSTPLCSDIEITIPVSSGKPVASNLTAKKAEDTGSLDQVLNILSFGLFANTTVELGVTVDDPGDASFDSLTINGVAAQKGTEENYYYINVAPEYANTGSVVTFYKGDQLISEQKMTEMQNVTTVSKIELPDDYSYTVTEAKPCVTIADGTDDLGVASSFEIPVNASSSRMADKNIGLSSFKLDIFSTDGASEEKVASFTCDGSQITPASGNEYDVVLTSGNGSAYADSAVALQDFVLQINKGDGTKLPQGAYSGKVSVQNNAGNTAEDDFTFTLKTETPDVQLEVSSDAASKELDGREVFDGKADVTFTLTDTTLDAQLLATGYYFTYSLDGTDVSPTEWTDAGNGSFTTSFEVTDEGEHSVVAKSVRDDYNNVNENIGISEDFAVDCSEAAVSIDYQSTVSENLISILTFGIYRSASQEINATITVSDAVAGVALEDISVVNAPLSGDETDVTKDFTFTTNDDGKTWTATKKLESDIAYRLNVQAKDRMGRSNSEAAQTLSPDTVKDEETRAVKEIALTNDTPELLSKYTPENANAAPIKDDFSFDITARSNRGGADPGLNEVKVFVYNMGTHKPEPDANGKYTVADRQKVITFTDTGSKITTDVIADNADDIFSLSVTGATGSEKEFSKEKVSQRDYKLAVNTDSDISSGYYVVKVSCKNNAVSSSNKNRSIDMFSMFEIDVTEPVVTFTYSDSDSNGPAYTDENGVEYFDQNVTISAAVEDNYIDAQYLNDNPEKFVYTLTDSKGAKYSFGTWTTGEDGKATASVTLDSEEVYTFTPVSLSDSTGNVKDLSSEAKTLAVDIEEVAITVDYVSGIGKSRMNSGMPFGMYRPSKISAKITVTDDIAGVDPDSIKLTNTITNEEIDAVTFVTDDGGKTYTGTFALEQDKQDKPYDISVSANDNIGRTESTAVVDYSVEGKEIDANYPELAFTQQSPVLEFTSTIGSPINAQSEITFNAYSANSQIEAQSGLKNVTVEVYFTGDKTEDQKIAVFTDNGKEIVSPDGMESKLVLERTNDTDTDFAQNKVATCGYKLTVKPGAENGLETGHYLVVVKAENNILRNDGNPPYSGSAETAFEVDVTPPDVSFEYTSSDFCDPKDDLRVYKDSVTIKAIVSDTTITAEYLNKNPDSFVYTLTGPENRPYTFGKWEETEEGKAVATVKLDAEGFYAFTPGSLTDSTGNPTTTFNGVVPGFGVDDTEANAVVSYSKSITDVIAEVLTFGIYTSETVNVKVTFTDEVAGVKTDSIHIYNDANGGHEEITSEFTFSTASGYLNEYEANATLAKNVAYVIRVEVKDNLDRDHSAASGNSTEIQPTELTEDTNPSKQTKEVASMDNTDPNKPVVTITEPAEWNDNSAEPLAITFSVQSEESEDGKADPGLRSVKAELFFAPSAAEKANDNWQSVAVFNDLGEGVETVDGYTLSGNGTKSFKDKKTSLLDYTLNIADKTSGYYKLVVTAENNVIDGDSYFTTSAEQQFGVDNKAPDLNVVFDNNDKKTDERDGKDYYAAERIMTVTLTEVSFDLDYVKEHYSDIITVGTPKDTDKLEWTQPKDNENVFVATAKFDDYSDQDSDGHFEVNIPRIVDKLGKSCKGFTDSFTIDKTKPVIEWKFTKATGTGPDKKYFAGSRKLEVKITEHNYTLDDVQNGAYLVYSITNDGESIADSERPITLQWSESGENVFTADYTFEDDPDIESDGEYTVVFTSLTDKARNPAANDNLGMRESFIVDNTKPVITWEYDNYDVKYPKDASNEDIYDQNRKLTVNITDHNLTVDDLNNTDQENPVYLVYSITNDGADTKDENKIIYLKWVENGENSFKAEYTFEDTDLASDGEYTVLFTSLTDRSGNYAENEDLGKTEKFIIDTTAPVIDIEYLNDNGVWYPDENGFEYFNNKDGKLTLKITVNEHNFTKSDVENYINYIIKNEHGEAQNIEKWADGEHKNEFVAKYEFLDNAEDPYDGDFTVNVDSLKDKVGHDALDQKLLDDETLTDEDPKDFAGHERTNIVIDSTAPVVKYSYDNDTFKAVDGGNYFDNNRTITVTVDDHGIKDATALEDISALTISAKNNGTWTDTKISADKWQKSGNVYTFTYTFEDTSAASDGDYKVVFPAFKDPAGNQAIDKDKKSPDNFINDSFVIDTTAPVITISYEPSAEVQGYRNWAYYDSAQMIATITVDEYNFKNSGDENYNTAEYQVVYITGNEPKVTTLNGGFTWTKTGNKYTTTVKLPGNSRISYFNFTTVDKAGNTAEKKPAKINTVIDNTAPKNLNIRFEKSVLDIIIGALTFGCYNTTTTVTVSADDDTAGIEYMTYECIGTGGSRSFSGTVDMKSGNADPKPTASYSFRVDPQFKGTVKLTVKDFSGNTTVYTTESDKKGIIVDNKNPLYETVKPELKASPAKTPRNNIYDGDVEIIVNSFDPVVNGVSSGVKEINYTITNPVTGYVETGKLTNTNTAVNTFDTKFNVDSNKFNANNVKLRMIATDNAGNDSDPFDLTVSIDITKPTIKVEYQGAQPNVVGGNEYYNSDRTAIITITERNFDPADYEYKIENTIPIGIKSVPSISAWTHNNNATDPDASTHTTKIVYHEDGYYRFENSFQDMAGNKATSPAADQFRMDQTKPEISISFDNNSALNDNYYQKPRTATITIRELNFSWSDVQYRLSATAADNSTAVTGPQLANMSDSGDVHTATVYFKDDGMFSFTVDETDFAKNTADRKSVSTFYLDQAEPTLEITGVSNDVAYPNVVSINIAIDDINYGGTYAFKLERIDMYGKRTTIPESSFSVTGDGKNISLTDLAHEIEFDGIYILSASATDKAGNTKPGTVRFSVNRFGSTYLLDDSAVEINNKCIKEERDIIITEYNADEITPDEVLVTIGGSTIPLKKDTDYTVTTSGDNETWYTAVYTINKSVFADNGEGLYKVLLKSKDNKLSVTNSNNDIDLSRGDDNKAEKLVVSFVLDKQAPMISISGIENDGTYEEASKTVTINITDSNFADAVTSENVIVTIGGTAYPVTEDMITKTESGYTITIGLEGNSEGTATDIEVTVYDKAGNARTVKIENVLVNANAFQRFIRNATAVTIAIIGFILLVIAIIVIIILVTKKKKKNQS